MSVESVMARVAELHSALSPQAAAATGGAMAPASLASAAPTATAAAAPTSFASMLGASGGVGDRIVNAVRNEVGQAEQPPGSNDSTRISQYRQATAGAPGPGPWCAYFVSWAAREAGTPIGEQGQGFGSVDAVYDWAQRAGRAVPASGGVPPRPGDLIVWDEHIGVVESVLPDGRIQTIEGNSSDQVARRTYGADGGGAVGYVRLG